MPGICYLRKLIWVCLCVVGVACTKSSSVPNENDKPDKPADAVATVRKYAVHFNIGNVDSVDGHVANKEMSIRSYMHSLFYLAYDSMGRRASKIVHEAVAAYVGPDFGIIKDSLAAGNYTIVIIGARFKSLE